MFQLNIHQNIEINHHRTYLIDYYKWFSVLICHISNVFFHKYIVYFINNIQHTMYHLIRTISISISHKQHVMFTFHVINMIVSTCHEISI